MMRNIIHFYNLANQVATNSVICETENVQLGGFEMGLYTLYICHVTDLNVQAVERGAGMDGQKITYSLIKHRLGDLFYRLV